MAATMQAVVFHGEGKLGIESAPLPRIAADDDVLLRVERPSICGTDIHILGSFIQRTEFPKVVRLLEAGILPLEKLVTHQLRLDQIGEGFDAMRTGEAIKVIAAP